MAGIDDAEGVTVIGGVAGLLAALVGPVPTALLAAIVKV